MLTKYPAYYVMGANTDIGKTLFSSGLCIAAAKEEFKTLYLKPIQTGFPKDSDSSFVKKFNPSDLVKAKTIFSLSEPLSPHRALGVSHFTNDTHNNENLEEHLISILEDEIKQNNSHFILIEGAGGAASPTLHGNLQCDFYRALRLPVIFIADAKLGGISCSISAISLLEARGFDISCILLFEGENENSLFLRKYYKDKYPVYELKNIKLKETLNDDRQKSKELEVWYDENSDKFVEIFQYLSSYHLSRIQIIEEYIDIAKNHIWWPSTQHKIVNAPKYIDSAFKDNINFKNQNSKNILSQNCYDASASWWTQGIGHASTRLAQAAVSAAGRYGHVMFPGHVHEPVAKLTQKLISTVGKGWASRVFYSDNGSTAIEVALKIAFRKSFGLPTLKNKFEICVIGLKDSYHGDTHATMDATNPNAFKKNEHWYTPKGYWLDYPAISMKNKNYIVSLPQSMHSQLEWNVPLNSIESFFEIERNKTQLGEVYLSYISTQMKYIESANLSIGALLLEPVIQGAGGMKFIDPLYQRLLVLECQKRKIPVILDEVFTGFWRLGKITAAQMLSVKPDISCFAKLLTGGLLPMSVTLAKEEFFECFLGDTLSNALLHGHSYTATPIGCSVALEAIEETQSSAHFCAESACISNVWNIEIIEKISCLNNVLGVYALGSLFALELSDSAPGYVSLRAKELIFEIQRLSIEVRPLGNIIYIFAGFNTPKKKLDSILAIVLNLLERECQ